MPNKSVLIGKVLASSYRRRLLEALADGPATPTMLEKRANVKMSHISEVLRELAKLGLVKITTPELRKGRLYEITTLGNSIVKNLKAKLI